MSNFVQERQNASERLLRYYKTSSLTINSTEAVKIPALTLCTIAALESAYTTVLLHPKVAPPLLTALHDSNGHHI